MPTSPSDIEISEETLHGYFDGQLPAGEARRVERYLETHPEVARELESWRETETGLREMLDDHLTASPDDIPPSRTAVERGGGWRAGMLAAAFALVFALGGGAGYLAHGYLNPPPARSDIADAGWLVSAARDIFLTYVREVRHPVEVGADEHEHLVRWLGNRIETEFTAPGLEPLGFELVGGRLLPVGGAPGAMLMYENAQGDRATILLARNVGARDTAFQFSQDAGVNTFRWIDGRLAYAISGFMDRPALEDISRAVYAHFQDR